MTYVWSLEQIKAVAVLRASGETTDQYSADMIRKDPEVVAATAADELRKAFIEQCRTHAVEVSPLDVMVEWGQGDGTPEDYGEPDSNAAFQLNKCVARWYPQRPVVLRGGPGEGQIMRTTGHPLSPGMVAFRVCHKATEEDGDAPTVLGTNGDRLVITDTVNYVLDGWDEGERLWVFAPAGGES